ncbi:MAG TPA: hypothetical protein VM165_14385, partial [Planctomycetaceae bacterium]|nr:hypothetical protein [Planctomycetaceae bacterium]
VQHTVPHLIPTVVTQAAALFDEVVLLDRHHGFHLGIPWQSLQTTKLASVYRDRSRRKSRRGKFSGQ